VAAAAGPPESARSNRVVLSGLGSEAPPTGPIVGVAWGLPRDFPRSHQATATPSKNAASRTAKIWTSKIVIHPVSSD